MIYRFIPIRTVSESNTHEHWSDRAKRAKDQRRIVAACIGAALPRVVITLTRVAPRRMDSDNLEMALKAVRDGVADALGMDDGNRRILWQYAQMLPDKRDRFGVEVEIRTNE